jgi:hypothetical protein
MPLLLLTMPMGDVGGYERTEPRQYSGSAAFRAVRSLQTLSHNEKTFSTT